VYLVEHGADISAATMRGGTALSVASEKGLLPIVTYLLEHGANVNSSNNNGITPLFWAAQVCCLFLLCILFSSNTKNI